MTTEETRETVARLRELLAKATPGEWEVLKGGNFVRVGKKGYVEWTESNHYLGGPLFVAKMHYEATEDYESNPELALANAELINETHNALPALLDRLEELEKELERLEFLRSLGPFEMIRARHSECVGDVFLLESSKVAAEGKTFNDAIDQARGAK